MVHRQFSAARLVAGHAPLPPPSSRVTATRCATGTSGLAPLSAEDGRDPGTQDDRDVEPDRPVLEIREVQPDQIVEGQAGAAGDLPETRDTGQHQVPLPMPRCEQLVVAERQRAWADEAHLPAQDVEHLRQLVDREPAQHPPDARHAGVVTDLEERSARLVGVLELALALGRAGDHRPELEHAELALADSHAPVDVEHRAARVELDRACDEQPERQPGDPDGSRHHEVERSLDGPVRTRQHRRPQLEQGHALARHVLALLDEKLGRARSEPDLDATAVRRLHHLEHPALVEITLAQDQLVQRHALENGGKLVEASEHGQARRRRVRDRPEEVEVDAPARRAQRPVQVREALPLADKDRPATNPDHAHQLERDRLVGGAQHDDHDRGCQRRCGNEAGGREVMTRADPEGKHDRGDEDQRRDDLAGAGATLPRRVEAGLPEDDQRDRDQEAKPLLRALPEQAPVDGLVTVDDLAHDECGVEPERQTDRVERRQRCDRAQAPAQRHPRAPREHVEMHAPDIGPGRRRIGRRGVG